MNRYTKYVILLITVAIVRLLFFTTINFSTFLILIPVGLLILFISAGISDELNSDNDDFGFFVTMLIGIIIVMVFLNKSGINCTNIEKVHTDENNRPQYVDDNVYYNLTCDKGSYYIDDDHSIRPDGKYNGLDSIHENKSKNKTTNYDKAVKNNE